MPKYKLDLRFQIENFLLSSDGEIKLCDFGSATTDTYAPDPSWSAQQRDTLEDQVSQFVYRVLAQFSIVVHH